MSDVEKALSSLNEPLPASHELGVGSAHMCRFSWHGKQGKPDDKVVRDALRSLGLTVWTWPADLLFFDPLYDSKVMYIGELKADRPGISVANVLQAMIQLGATHGLVSKAEIPYMPGVQKGAKEAGDSAGDTAQDVADWFSKYGPWVLGLTALAAVGALVGWFVIRPMLAKKG